MKILAPIKILMQWRKNHANHQCSHSLRLSAYFVFRYQISTFIWYCIR